MSKPRLTESAYAEQMEHLDIALENDAQTFAFQTKADLEWAIETNDLERVDDQLPADREAVESRIDAGDHICPVTLTTTERAIIRTKEVEKTNEFNLQHLYQATKYLPDQEGSVADASFYCDATEGAPLMVEFPQSPPELVSLQRQGELKGPESVDDSECVTPSACLIPASDV